MLCHEELTKGSKLGIEQVGVCRRILKERFHAVKTSVFNRLHRIFHCVSIDVPTNDGCISIVLSSVTRN